VEDEAQCEKRERVRKKGGKEEKKKNKNWWLQPM